MIANSLISIEIIILLRFFISFNNSLSFFILMIFLNLSDFVLRQKANLFWNISLFYTYSDDITHKCVHVTRFAVSIHTQYFANTNIFIYFILLFIIMIYRLVYYKFHNTYDITLLSSTVTKLHNYGTLCIHSISIVNSVTWMCLRDFI